VLGSTTDGLLAGAGTYVLAGHSAICAGVVGVARVHPLPAEDGGNGSCSTKNKGIVSIEARRAPSRLPVVGDVVTARVTRINARMVSLDILCVHSQPAAVAADSAAASAASAAGATLSSLSGETHLLDESLAGTIRQRDVRAFDVDSVELYRCYRPGDLVRAQVLSLGDARSYFLSTARNDLGVVLATSAAGQPMIPVNWETMQCPLTGAKEARKVAKID
jgi:exosome complex RNA-binding protein Csl4